MPIWIVDLHRPSTCDVLVIDLIDDLIGRYKIQFAGGTVNCAAIRRNEGECGAVLKIIASDRQRLVAVHRCQ